MKNILVTIALLISFGSFGQNKSSGDLIQSIVDLGNESEGYKKQLEMLADTYNGDIRQMSKEYLDAFEKYEDELKKKSNKFNSKRLKELQELEIVIKNYELATQKDLYNKAIIFMDDIIAKLKTFGTFSSIGQTDEEYFKSANSKDAAGDYLGALEDYDKAIEINPNNARIYSNRGLAKNSLKDYSGAIEDFNKSIEIDPTNSYPYYNTGIAKYNLQDYSGALESYNKAIDLDPNYTDAYFNRSLTKAYLGNFIGSLMDSDYTIKLNPNYAQAYVNRGVAKLNTNDKQGACQDARKAQSLGYDSSQLIKLTCN